MDMEAAFDWADPKAYLRGGLDISLKAEIDALRTMAFIDRILKVPSYGWKTPEGELSIPTKKQLWNEALTNLNIFKDRRNWIAAISWIMVFCMVPFFVVWMTSYFSWGTFGAFMLYAMIIMSTHGTIWYHRFGTHKAYTFSSPIWRFITQNLVIKTFPEEVYIVSHHVHHAKSDEAGDPYNARAGFLYCMLSDVNHQAVAQDFTEQEFNGVKVFMEHTGVGTNDYEGYKKWGSIATPGYTLALWFGNWAFWYTAFYLMGGHGLACAMFSGAMFWFVLVRAFNYNGHGKGEEMHKDGIDFDRSNLAINQTRTGLFSGEWHNNHHLYPGSARAGFLPYQFDLPWVYIWSLHKLGAIDSYEDAKPKFMKKYMAAKSGTAFAKKPEGARA